MGEYYNPRKFKLPLNLAPFKKYCLKTLGNRNEHENYNQ